MMSKNNVEKSLKEKLNAEISEEPSFVEEVSRKARQQQGVKDVLSIFVGWVWVLFAAFGAKTYVTLHQNKHHSKNIRGK